MTCRSCKKEPPRSEGGIINKLAGWVPALHPDDVGLKAACPECGKVAVVALVGGGIKCGECGYTKPSPYSGTPGQWACAIGEARSNLSVAVSYIFMDLVMIFFSVGFFGYMLFVGFDGALVGGGVSTLLAVVVLAPFLMSHWQTYRIRNSEAKAMWSGMDDLDRRAARYIRHEMEQDLGF